MKHESTNRTSSVVAYVHDANGNLTGDGVFSYAYDTANQLTNVVRTADGARVLSARYDALGRRVEATRADGSVERYVYFPGSFLVLAVLDGTNAVKEVYTRGPDLSGTLDGAGGIGGILAVTDSSSVVRYYHADIMGNVIALTDASGSVVATFRYTPFGQLSARTGSVLPRYLFSSKEFDRTANLYYYGYRYYAPRMGRWMTRDPIGNREEKGLYCFLSNQPLSEIDKLGLAGINEWTRVTTSPVTMKYTARYKSYILGEVENWMEVYTQINLKLHVAGRTLSGDFDVGYLFGMSLPPFWDKRIDGKAHVATGVLCRREYTCSAICESDCFGDETFYVDSLYIYGMIEASWKGGSSFPSSLYHFVDPETPPELLWDNGKCRIFPEEIIKAHRICKRKAQKKCGEHFLKTFLH